MQKVLKPLGNLVFLLFLGGVVVFLLSLSWSALSRVFPDSLVDQIFGLVNFDIAAAAWLLAFVYVARGSIQRAISFWMFLVSVLGVAVVVALEVGLSAGVFGVEDVMRPLAYVLIGLTVIHVVAGYFFHLFGPDVQNEIMSQAEVDETIEQAQRDAAMAMAELRPRLARRLAEARVDGALRDLGLWESPVVVDVVEKKGEKESRWWGSGWRVPLLEAGPSKAATDGPIPVCVYCARPLDSGQKLYCSSEHEAEHLRVMMADAQARLARIEPVQPVRAERIEPAGGGPAVGGTFRTETEEGTAAV